MNDEVRIRYCTPTEDGYTWMLSGLMSRDTAQQIIDSGAYANAYILEEE